MSQPSSSKTAIWIIIAVIAIVLAVFSAYRSFAPKQGKAKGHLDIAPGGKAGLMKGGPSAEGMEQPTPAGR